MKRENIRKLLACSAVAVAAPLYFFAPGSASKRQRAPFMGRNFPLEMWATGSASCRITRWISCSGLAMMSFLLRHRSFFLTISLPHLPRRIWW